MKKIINSFLHPNSNDDKIITAYIVSLIIGILGFCMAPLCYINGNFQLFIISLIYGSICLLSFLFTLLFKNLICFYIASISLIIGLEITYIFTGGSDGFGILWMSIVPLFTLYLYNFKFFIGINSTVLAILILGMWTPLKQFGYNYNPLYQQRIPILFLVQFIFCLCVKFKMDSTEKNKTILFKELLSLQENLRSQLNEKNESLKSEKKQNTELMMEIITTLTKAIDSKDPHTVEHSLKVANYSKILAKKLEMSEKDQEDIYLMGLLHDVGKISTPEAILNKTDKLSDEEMNIIKEHTKNGGEILKNINSIPDIFIGAMWHHERYDGTGYPDNLSGEKIPLMAQIICVADAYDAMNSDRSYRKRLSKDQIIKELEKGKGTQFSSVIAEKMIEYINEN